MKVKTTKFYRCENYIKVPGRKVMECSQASCVPDDMLRYDMAFINDKEPNIVAFPKFQVPKEGTVGGKPTDGRWSSFGVILTEVDDDKYCSLTGHGIDPKEWYTYRHPRSGSLDLVKVTLETYLAAKNHRELP